MNIDKPLQTKTIAKICNQKIQNWAKSVENAGNKEIADIIRNKTMITGGALVSLLTGKPVNDYDIYFLDQESAFKVAQYYVEYFKKNCSDSIKNEKISRFEVVKEIDRVKIIIKSAGVAANPDDSVETDSPTEYQYFEATNGDEAETYLQSLANKAANKSTGKYEPVFISDNAITLSDKIQLVIRFYGTPKEIHKNYDFVHCTNIYTSWDKKVILNMDAMESIRTKTLKYVGSLYPVCSVLRLRKFIARGWHINAGQVLKMLWQIKDLNLDDPTILQEQLVGCDAAYFNELLKHLREDINSGKTIDQLYISNLVDMIFE